MGISKKMAHQDLPSTLEHSIPNIRSIEKGWTQVEQKHQLTDNIYLFNTIYNHILYALCMPAQ